MTQINRSNSIMLLATRFDNLGGWTVEQQFVLQMGSSYLLAHGIGTPIAEDPTTKVKIEKAGKYTLWVRTKNWTAFWSEGKTPGIFQVKVDGVADAAEFGLVDKQVVSVKVDSDGRSLIFGDVVVRVNDTYALAMHIDTDESNAAGMAPGTMGEVIK